MESVSRTGYLTMRQAAAWLGMGGELKDARRLQRLLETIERSLGRELMRRTGSGTGVRLSVTRAVLRAHLQEHWLGEDRVVHLVREHVAKLEERVAALETELAKGRIERRVLGRKVAQMARDLLPPSGAQETAVVPRQTAITLTPAAASFRAATPRSRSQLGEPWSR